MTAADEWGAYEYALLPVADLFVDSAYQRPLSTFARRIEEHFDPLMVGTIIVSDRGEGKRNRYAVIDGQTRVHGMDANDIAHAPCLVYVGLSRQQEAELFARLQIERRGMATWVRFRAAIVSKQPEAMAIAAACEDEGWRVAGSDGTDHGIRSIAGLEWLYRKDPELLRRVLRVITNAWGTQEDSSKADPRVRGEILQGIGRFLWWEVTDADDDRLARNLKGITPDQLRHRANALREGQGASSSSNYAQFIAEALIGVYASKPRSAAA